MPEINEVPVSLLILFQLVERKKWTVQLSCDQIPKHAAIKFGEHCFPSDR